MNRLTLISAAVASVLLAGCSSSHSPKIQKSIDESKEIFEGGFQSQVQKYKPYRAEIGKIHTDRSYHDINNYQIIQKDERKLPEVFSESTINKRPDSEAQYTVDEFSALIYESFGIILDVSSPDLNSLAENNDTQPVFDTPNTRARLPQPNVGITGDSTGNFEAVNNLLEDDAKSKGSRDNLKLKKFSYEGTLKGMLDYVSQLNGLKWKYDEEFNKAYLYAYDTKTFKIFENGDDIKISSSITTDATQDTENTSGGSERELTRDVEIKTWDEIKESVNNIVSDEFGKATFNTKSGLITVRDSDYNLSQVRDYVKQLNDINSTNITVQFKIIQFEYTDGDNHQINQSYLNDGLQNNLLGSFDLNYGTGSLSPDILGNLGAFQELVQGNYLSIATDSHQFLMGFLNEIGTAKVAYETQVEVLNNDINVEQKQRTEEYIASIERSNNLEGTSSESISTERDVGVDGINVSLMPKIVGDKIMVKYAVNSSDFIGLKDAGLGSGLEGIKLKTQTALNLDNTATVINGVPKVVKFTQNSEDSTTSQGMFDDFFWFLGGSETRSENQSATIVTITAYYNN